MKLGHALCWHRTMAIVVAVLILGCNVSPSASERDPDEVTEAAPREAGSRGAAVDSASEETAWDLIQMEGQPVGWQRLRMAQTTEGGQAQFDAEAESLLAVQRFGQRTEEQLSITSRETAAGELVHFHETSKSGNQFVRTSGVRQNGESVGVIEMTATTGTATERWQLAVPADQACGGPFAIESSLRRQPMQPGEMREVTLVLPLLHLVARAELHARDWEPTPVWQGNAVLLRIEQTLHVPRQPTLSSVAWTDKEGRVIKTELPQLRQQTLRVDERVARQATAGALFDLSRLATVRLTRPLLDPHRADVLQLRVRSGSPSDHPQLPQTSRQHVEPASDGWQLVTLRRQPTWPATELPPEAQDRESSALIPLEDPAIRELVVQLSTRLPPTASDRDRALATEAFVHEWISTKDFASAFAGAAEVARSRRGDCTEHAVLTAALCRAQGIPTRVAMGLIYVASSQAYVFHMWNEVWVADDWLPIDSTLAQQGIGVGHLTLAVHALGNADTYELIWPLMTWLGQMEIEVVE